MKIYIGIDVPDDWEDRMDMQQTLEREVQADRWSWHKAIPETQPHDWSVFNTGAEVASGLSYKEAMESLTHWKPTDAALTALKRFAETCEDGEGYDVPADTMHQLACIGLVRKVRGTIYQSTDFGQHVLDATGAAPKEPSKVEVALSNLLMEIDTQCGNGMMPWQIEDAYAAYEQAQKETDHDQA